MKTKLLFAAAVLLIASCGAADTENIEETTPVITTIIADGEQQSKEPPDITGVQGETLLFTEAENVLYDAVTDFPREASFPFAYVASAPFTEIGEHTYEKVMLGQKIGGMEVTDALTVYEFIHGAWSICDSRLTLSGEIELTGYIGKTSDDEMQLLSSGTLTFGAYESANGFIPLIYSPWVSESEGTAFILDGYDPEAENPDFFAGGAPVHVTAVLSSLTLRYTERATGGNFAVLTSLA